MRFKIDENLPKAIVSRFQTDGYDSISVLDQNLGGRSDNSLAEVCRKEDRVLITLDLDFADVRAYPPQSHPSIIVLRLNRQDKEHVLEVIARVLPMFKTEPLSGHLWIVEEDAVRIRGEF